MFRLVAVGVVHREEGRPVVHRKTVQCKKSREGQAMSEFLVGLVGIMFLVVGLLQYREMSINSFEGHIRTREDLAKQMNDDSSPQGDFIFSQGASIGADEKMYTGDDGIESASQEFFNGADPKGFLSAVGYNDSDADGGTGLESYLSDYDSLDPLNRLGNSSGLAESYGMLLSTDTVQIDVLPFLRRVLGRSTVTIERKAWMPRTEGLMD
jgi:hypothetical protein